MSAQTPFRRALRSFLEQRTARVGLIIFGVLLLAAIGADVISTYDPTGVLIDVEPTAKRLAGPCINLFGCEGPQHLFGLDSNVRDVFARVIHGARLSLQVGVLTVGFAIVIGTLLGAVAGYAGGAIRRAHVPGRTSRCARNGLRAGGDAADGQAHPPDRRTGPR